MKLASKQIGFIGGGAMAEALAGGLIGAGVPAANVLVIRWITAEAMARIRSLASDWDRAYMGAM